MKDGWVWCYHATHLIFLFYFLLKSIFSVTNLHQICYRSEQCPRLMCTHTCVGCTLINISPKLLESLLITRVGTWVHLSCLGLVMEAKLTHIITYMIALSGRLYLCKQLVGLKHTEKVWMKISHKPLDIPFGQLGKSPSVLGLEGCVPLPIPTSAPALIDWHWHTCNRFSTSSVMFV